MPFGYRVFNSPAGATATGTFTTADIGGSNDRVFAQITITGVAAVVIDGSLDDINFIAVTPSIGASTIWELDPAVPYYRSRVTSYASGAITVGYGPGEGRLRELQSISGKLMTSGGPQ